MYCAGQQEITEPIASAVLDTATIAAMESLTPTHLCVRVPRKESSIKYGFAASRGFSQSKRQLVIDTDNSDRGLTTADSALTLDSLADSPGKLTQTETSVPALVRLFGFCCLALGIFCKVHNTILMAHSFCRFCPLKHRQPEAFALHKP